MVWRSQPRTEPAPPLPARASLFGDDLTNRQARNGSQPFAVVGDRGHRDCRNAGASRGVDRTVLRSDLLRGIAARLQAALADPGIRGIALDIDSFGGEVAGAFDLADRIRAARHVKPVQAFVADHALSAAYASCRLTGSFCRALALSAASVSWPCTAT